jgi:hypothetical protein
MKFLQPIKPRFKKVWAKVVLMQDIAANPFPGKRKCRWAITSDRHGALYEGKPSKQAIRHAIWMARVGRRMYLVEFDKKTPFSVVTFDIYDGALTRVSFNEFLWKKYHKMDMVSYYQAWRRKSRGMAR